MPLKQEPRPTDWWNAALAAGLDSSPTYGLGWHLLCPVCRGWVADGFLHEQAARLGHHLVDRHPYELRVLEIGIDAGRRRAAT